MAERKGNQDGLYEGIQLYMNSLIAQKLKIKQLTQHILYLYGRIEERLLHWSLDVSFNEDQSQAWKDNVSGKNID